MSSRIASILRSDYLRVRDYENLEIRHITDLDSRVHDSACVCGGADEKSGLEAILALSKSSLK